MFGKKKKKSFILPPEDKSRQEEKTTPPPEELDDQLPEDFSFSAAFDDPEEVEQEAETAPVLTETKKERKAREKAEKRAAKELRNADRLPFFRDKRKVGILLITLSLVTTLVISPAIAYFTAEKTTTVAVATQDLPVGKLIEREMVSNQTVPVQSVLPFQQLQAEDVIGKYVSSSMVQNEIISTMKLSNTLPFDNAYLYELPEGQKAISITIPQLATAVSAKIMSGDIVSVYAVLPQKEDEDPAGTLFPELTYMRVLATTNQDGYDLTGTPAKEGVESPLPATITLQANDRQAELLAGLEVNARLWLGLVYRGEPDGAQGYLDQQQQYFDDLKAEQEAAEKEIKPPASSAASTPAPPDTSSTPGGDTA